jgi:hypothetical protein
MKIKVVLIVISIILMIAGFGMIHNGNPVIEYTGSAMIGLPAVYLLVLLFRTYSKMNKND